MTNKKLDNSEIIKSLGFKKIKSIPELLKSGEGRYFIVNVIAKRSAEINVGSKPLMNADDPLSECYPYAAAEAENDKLKVTPKKMPNKLVDLIDGKH